LFQYVNLTRPVDSAAMESLRKRSISIYNCPSDSGFKATIDIPGAGGEVLCQMAASSYVASAGTIRPTCRLCRDNFDGVFGRNHRITPGQLGDGLSRTFAAGERSTHWANAALWGVVPNSILPDHQIPGKYAAGPAYVLGTTFAKGFNIESSELDSASIDSLAESFGSAHTNGVNFLYCDAGVRFLSNGISPAIMNSLATRDSRPHSGKEVVIHDSPF
jgi:prepilin-type processing-associated H-X9-DG protein